MFAVQDSDVKVNEFRVAFNPPDEAELSAQNKGDEDGEGKEVEEEIDQLISVSIKSVRYQIVVSF